MAYAPRPDRDDRLASAILIAQWASQAPGLYEAHRRETLSIACWKATELDGKWNTRLRSRGVLTAELGTPVNHEHVVTRKCLVTAMVKHPDSCEPLLSNAVGCLVTREEHARLNTGFGWERYAEAEIEVIDMVDGTVLDLDKANERLKRTLGGLIEDC